MANSNRRYKDLNGNMFIPMNVQGHSWNENFITTPKLITLGCIGFSLIGILVMLGSEYAPFRAYLVYLSLWGVLTFYALRFIIFEEVFYYKMYKKMKNSEITTPAAFWDIASLKETDNGAIMTYSDARIAIIVKLERDTITGKHPDFKENHYDAISDFYKELVSMNYSFIQLNLMEQAGNDPRLLELDKLITKSDNKNIKALMENQVGFIKTITHRTLYENDYILVYTSKLSKLDNIMNDVVDCVYKLMDGAFIGYRILNSREIIELVKETYGVNYFDYTSATLDMFKGKVDNMTDIFNIERIYRANGEIIELDKRDRNKLNKITSGILCGSLNIDSQAILDTLKVDDSIDKIEFDNLGQEVKLKKDRSRVSLEKDTKLVETDFDFEIELDDTEISLGDGSEGKSNRDRLMGNKERKIEKYQKDESTETDDDEVVDFY